MDVHNLYYDYGYKQGFYFASGISKIMDLMSLNMVSYPGYMSDKKAMRSDADTLRKDFELVGSDMRKALDDYEKECICQK